MLRKKPRWFEAPLWKRLKRYNLLYVSQNVSLNGHWSETHFEHLTDPQVWSCLDYILLRRTLMKAKDKKQNVRLSQLRKENHRIQASKLSQKLVTVCVQYKSITRKIKSIFYDSFTILLLHTLFNWHFMVK